MFVHQRAAHVDRGVARNAADLVEGRAPAGRAQHLAAEMLGIARDAVGLAYSYGWQTTTFLQPSALAAAACADVAVETFTFSSASRSRIICSGIGGAARQIDRHAAEHDDVAAGRRHLARGAHADVVGLVDLVLAAHHDGERGDHQRHAGRHDFVELVRKHFGGERRRGVADAGAAAIDVAAGLIRSLRRPLLSLGRGGYRPLPGLSMHAMIRGSHTGDSDAARDHHHRRRA